MWSAPAAARRAATLGQPSRGLTRRSRLNAKLPMARAAMPMFSPSCGSTRITTGPARSGADFVLSVPDITLLSSPTSEDSEPRPEADLIQRLPQPHSVARPVAFLKEFIGLATISEIRPQPSA